MKNTESFLELYSGTFKSPKEIDHEKAVTGTPVTFSVTKDESGLILAYDWTWVLDENGVLWDGVKQINAFYVKGLPVIELQKVTKEIKVIGASGKVFKAWAGELKIHCLVNNYENPNYSPFIGKERPRNAKGDIKGCNILNLDEYLPIFKQRMSTPQSKW